MQRVALVSLAFGFVGWGSVVAVWPRRAAAPRPSRGPVWLLAPGPLGVAGGRQSLGVDIFIYIYICIYLHMHECVCMRGRGWAGEGGSHPRNKNIHFSFKPDGSPGPIWTVSCFSGEPRLPMP